MNIFKKITAALACVCFVGASGAMAAETDFRKSEAAPLEVVQVNPEIMRAPETYVTTGVITAIEDGTVIVKGEGHRKQVALIVDRDTYIANGHSGKLRLPMALKIGQKVTAYYSALMTRSMPPQSYASAIVLGSRSEGSASFFQVAQAELAQDGSYITLLNSNHDLIAAVDAAACTDYAKIKKGDKLLLWNSFVTMSLPGQTKADKVIVLP